jgi:hypothetical protein
MSQETMYPPQANSPGTELAQAITADAVELTVQDGDVLLDAPNTVTIGSDETAETILYGKKEGNVLSEITRAWDGTAAKAWTTGSKVARYLNAQDISAIQHNIRDLNEQVSDLPEQVQEIKDEVNNLDWQKYPLTDNDGTSFMQKDIDVNTLLQAGQYVVESPINGPTPPNTSSDIWYVDVTVSKNDVFVTQMFRNYFTNALFLRNKKNGEWREYSRDLVNTNQATSTKNYDFYVDGTNGSDSNNGLTLATAFKTIAKPLSILRTFAVLNHGFTIRIAAGTYNEAIIISNLNGNGNISIQYVESKDAVQDKINITNVSLVNCHIPITFNAITATINNNGQAFYIYRCSEVTFNNCYTTKGAGIGFYIHNSSVVISSGVISNTTSYAVYAIYLSTVTIISANGTANNIGIYAAHSVFVAKNNVSISATTSEQYAGGAMIR